MTHGRILRFAIIGVINSLSAIPAAAVAIPFTFLIAQFALTGGSHEQSTPGPASQPSEEMTA